MNRLCLVAVLLLASLKFVSAQTIVSPTMTSDTSSTPTGCTASARSESSWGGGSGQAYTLFDGVVTGTNGWYDHDTASSANPDWAQLSCTTAITADSYAITSRCDNVGGDDAHAWTLTGSNDGVNFTTIDTQSNVSWTAACSKKTFSLASAQTFKTWRLNITVADANQPVITEWQLLSANSGGGGNNPPPQQPPVGPLLISATVPLPCPAGKSIDLLAGTIPSPMPSPQNNSSGTYNGFQNGYDTTAAAIAAITGCRIPVLGNSVVAEQDVTQFHPFAINFGIGSDAVSDVLNRIQGYAVMHNGLATIYFDPGINDINAGEGVSTIVARNELFLAWSTGPLVYVAITQTNIPAIDSVATQVNAQMKAIIATRPNSVFVDPGTITTNGGHPDAASSASIIAPAVIAGLAQVLH